MKANLSIGAAVPFKFRLHKFRVLSLGMPMVDNIPTSAVQRMSHPRISLTGGTVAGYFFLVPFKDGSWYFLCLGWSRVSLRFPTSGDQRMSHPAPVSGPELITTRQLVAGNYLTYHPNGKPNINNIKTENKISITITL